MFLNCGGGPLAVSVGGDEPVALQALQGRIDLADVERPDFARTRLELALQPQPVLRLLPQEGEESMGDAHVLLQVNILGMYTRYVWPAQVVERSELGETLSGSETLSRVRAADVSSARLCP